jgi:hypothetical protein
MGVVNMGGKGYAGSGRRSRPRDEARVRAEFRTVVLDGEVRGFALPEGVLPDGEDWHPQTREWWETWRTAPQSAEMLPTDWDFLLDTALMHHVMWTKGRWEFASEIRLRAAKFGATVEDRMRLKMKVELPGPAAVVPKESAAGGGSVTSIASRRARLTE